jgi:putative ABC transport system permease protein
MSSALGTIITLATALLAVAVIIAIVGIGNTLGLSVIERTRESALLRALGLHRRQLRLMLAVEAALLAGVGAAVGVVAGIGYGWIGVASAFGEAGETMVIDIPWGQLGLVLLLAVVAALLASVLPARRAAKATPTQALAEV